MTRRVGQLAVLGCVFAAGFAGGCVRKPEIELSDIRLARLGARQMDLVLEFEVCNPNWFDIRLADFDYTLTAMGQRITAGQLEQPIGPFKACGRTKVRAPATIEGQTVLAVLRQVYDRKPIDYEIDSTATFKVLGLNVPVPLRKADSLEMARLPVWRLHEVKFSMTQLDRVELIFDVENPNDFELPVISVSGAIRADDRVVLEIDAPSSAMLAPHESVRVGIPVRVDASSMLDAVKDAWASRRPLRFDADVKISPSISLTRSLLRRSANP